MFGLNDPASVLGFFISLFLDPLFWFFIIFWIVFAVTKKRWAKITAIVFTCLVPLALFMAWAKASGLWQILLEYANSQPY